MILMFVQSKKDYRSAAKESYKGQGWTTVVQSWTRLEHHLFTKDKAARWPHCTNSIEHRKNNVCKQKIRLLCSQSCWLNSVQTIEKIVSTFNKDKDLRRQGCLPSFWPHRTLFTLYKPSEACIIEINDGILLRVSMNLFTIERLFAIMLTSLYNNF